MAFLFFSINILNNYKTTSIKSEETRLFQTANIVADLYRENMDDIIYLNNMIRDYAKRIDARILVLNDNKTVLIDSNNDLYGQFINNKEIESSLNNHPGSDIYNIDEKKILQATVPIRINHQGQEQIRGVVLISKSISFLWENISNLRKDIIKVSSIALFIAIFLIAITTNTLTKSLRELSKGVSAISGGSLGYKVEHKSKDEVGELIDTFNKMSTSLYDIEANRKLLINSVSHELRTPLTSIEALIDSLLIGENDIRVYKEFLKDIKNETARMKSLINHLTQSIKLEDINLNLTYQDLGKLLEETVKFITPYANKNQVDISLDLDGNIKVYCDRDKLKEVFINLIENAIKYKDKNKKNPMVQISLREEKNSAQIVIKDNGIGIDKSDIPAIFKREFRRINSALTEPYVEGQGIGLAIVKKIVDKHQWKIHVESSLGQGSQFIITIPK
ncbi:MAG TPA: HAMP domain-containing sensor histidine kinase [Tissierellaceae bacterium]|nr:HAMP domain-containing sensor histidine kinase [Tissierellaceae bacterium]